MRQASSEGRIQLEQPVTGLASLRTRLIAANMIITGLAIAALGYYVYYRSQQSSAFLAAQLETNIHQRARDSLAAESAAQASSLDSFFGEMRRGLEVLKATATNLLSRSPTSAIEGAPGFALVRLVNGSWDNSNEDTASVFIPAPMETVDAILPELTALRTLDDVAPEIKEANPDTVAIYFGGVAGETLYYPNIDLANVVPPDFDVTKRPWFVAAAPGNNPQKRSVWSDPYLDAALHGLVVTVSNPVFDSAGNFRGVIAMDVQLKRISNLVSNIHVETTGYAFVLDGDRRVIAMPAAAYQDLGLSPEDLPLGDVMDAAKLGDRLPADFLSSIGRLVAGQNDIETLTLKGVERFIAYHNVPEVGYSLVIVVPSQELLAGAAAARAQVMRSNTDTLQISLVLVVVILAFALLATLALGSSLTSPLVALTQTAEEITGGNLNARASIASRDEIGILARTLNSMTSSLRSLIESLEQRVRERTAALETASKNASRRASQFEAITQVMRAISSSRNVEELMPLVTSVISGHFGFYHVGIFLNDEDGRFTHLIAANSEGGHKMLNRHHRLKVGEQGIVGFVAAAGEPRVARVVGEDSVFFDNPDLPETQSEAALPLRSGGEIIGVLDVQSTAEDAFSPDDLNILAVLADQVSLAFDNTRLLEATQRSLLEAETLYRQYVRDAWSRLSQDNEFAGFRYTALGAEPLGRTAAYGLESAGSSMTGKGEALKIPIKLRGEVIADLEVQPPQDGDWSQDEMDLVQAVADRVALAAENARLFEETMRRAERERLVTEITSKIRGSNDPQEMIKTALEELKSALGASHIQLIPQRISAASPDPQAATSRPSDPGRQPDGRNGATK